VIDRFEGRRRGGLFIRALPPILAVSLLVPGAGEVRGQDAAGPQLSLDEALDQARRNNPGFRIEQSQLEPAELRIREAYFDFLPSANVSGSMGYTAAGERRFSSVALGVQPAIYSSSYNMGLSLSMNGASLLRPGQARAQAGAVQARVEGAASGLVQEVTLAYLAVLEADAELEQARNELERSRGYVLQAEAQVSVGTGTPLDIRRAEVQEGQSEVRVLQAENGVVNTRLALGRVLGTRLPDGVRLTSDFPLFDPQLDTGELIAETMSRNPQLRAFRADTEVAGTQLRVARTQYMPSLSLSAGIQGSVFQPNTIDPLVDDRLGQLGNQYNNCLEDNRIRSLLGDPPRDCSPLNPQVPEVADRAREQVRAANDGFPFDYRRQPLSLSLSLSLPVYTGYSRRVQMEEARVGHSNARERLREEELRLRSEVESAVLGVETARRTVALQQRIRATSGEELRLAQERFRLGLASSIEVVDAQTNLSEAERSEIAAVYNFHRALAALEALVGGPLR